jgi:hypothetical protein
MYKGRVSLSSIKRSGKSLSRTTFAAPPGELMSNREMPHRPRRPGNAAPGNDHEIQIDQLAM